MGIFRGARAALTINCLHTSLHLVEQEDVDKIHMMNMQCSAHVQCLGPCTTAHLRSDFHGICADRECYIRGVSRAKVSRKLDSIAVSIFVDILVELTNTVSEAKIQITLLIVRRGALSIANISP